jgi:hypothetical protein
MKHKNKAAPKPRNPFVQHLLKRPSGVHSKNHKTTRRDAKMVLKKDADCSDKLGIVFLSSLHTRILYTRSNHWSIGAVF